MHAARARGRNRGRRKALSDRQVAMARKLYADKSNTIADICKTLRCSRATLYRAVRYVTALSCQTNKLTGSREGQNPSIKV